MPSVFEDEQTVEVVAAASQRDRVRQTGAPWFVAAGFRVSMALSERPSLLPGDLADVPLPEFPTLPDGAPDLGYHMPVDDFLLEFMDPQRCGSHDLNARNGWAFPDAQQWRRAYWASVSYMDSWGRYWLRLTVLAPPITPSWFSSVTMVGTSASLASGRNFPF